MQIVEEGDSVSLVVDRGPELRFPIRLIGQQLVVPLRNARNWRLFLRLAASDGATLLLEEVRGLIHGRQEDWLYGLNDPDPRPDYVARANTLARIRALVDRQNEEHSR